MRLWAREGGTGQAMVERREAGHGGTLEGILLGHTMEDARCRNRDGQCVPSKISR